MSEADVLRVILELISAAVLISGGWFKLQELTLASQKAAAAIVETKEAVGTVHTMINSELSKWKDEVVARMTAEVKLAYAKGLGEGGEKARALAAEALVAAAAALPPVIVSPLEAKIAENTAATQDNTARMGEPDPDHVGIRRS